MIAESIENSTGKWEAEFLKRDFRRELLKEIGSLTRRELFRFPRFGKNGIIAPMINFAALPLTYLILGALILLLFLLAGLQIGILLGRRSEEMEWRSKRLDEVVKARIKTSRAVLGGQFSEQLAPFLPDFPYPPGECRFLGKPIDPDRFPDQWFRILCRLLPQQIHH